MRNSIRLILMAFEILITVSVFFVGVGVYKGMTSATMTQVTSEKEYFTDVELGDLSDLNRQTLVGTEVKNLIKKYLDPYSIRIVDNDGGQIYTDKESAVGAVESTALYLCQLMGKSSDGGYQETDRADRAIRIDFTRETMESEVEALNYAILAEAIGWTGEAPTQEFLDAASDIVTALKSQNALLAQHTNFQVDRGVVMANSQKELEFVPTDLIVKSNNGNTGYLDLNGTADAAAPATGNTKEIELFESVRVYLRYEDDVIVKCTIKNNSGETINYKSLQISEN